MTGLRVQTKPCATCIYRKDSPNNLKKLEADVKNERGDFVSHRVCHHADDVMCRGFYNAHKDEYWATQLAQRLDAVDFVEVDTWVKA